MSGRVSSARYRRPFQLGKIYYMAIFKNRVLAFDPPLLGSTGEMEILDCPTAWTMWSQTDFFEAQGHTETVKVTKIQKDQSIFYMGNSRKIGPFWPSMCIVSSKNEGTNCFYSQFYEVARYYYHNDGAFVFLLNAVTRM